ncbi:hypothetical protein ACFLSK_02685 [Chloroflexota bacterium]
MGNRLLIDNWMLQDINEAMQVGLSEEDAREITIDLQQGTHNFQFMPHAVFQIDSLIALLVNIVFRDELIVDDRFTYVWENGHESLRNLKNTGILNPFDFLSSEESIAEPRKVIVNRLCVTQSILDIQRENERSWEENRESKDKYMSQLVWGGAGYLARSHVYETPYLGCPFRQALIRQTEFINGGRDAVWNMETVINTKRAKLFQSLTKARNAKYAAFNLPPVAIEVIENSNGLDQLITVARGLRDKYKELRLWLGKYQEALDSEDPLYIKKHVRLLESIADDIENKYSTNGEDAVKLSLGVDWLNLNVPIGRLITKVKNRFGVRAMLSGLVLSKQGNESIKKLLTMFGEKNNQLSMDVQKYLVHRYSS